MQQQTRTATHSMEYSMQVCSKSKHDHDVDINLQLHSFDKGVTNLKVTVNGEPVEAKVEKGLLELNVPVSADGESEIAISFKGKQTEYRSVPYAQ